MAWRDKVKLPFVMQCTGEPLDLLIGSFHQMKTAYQKVCVRIDSRGRRENFFDAGMRAPHDDHQSLRRVDSERKLSKLERSGYFGDGGNQENSRRDFSAIFDAHKVCPRPGTSGGKGF